MTDTNPRPCGICGESCGWTTDGNGDHQCAVFGRLWADDSPTGTGFAANLLGVARETVDKWVVRGIYPEPSWPVDETAGRRLVRRDVLLAWAKQTGRL